jgi:hypothetical protein
MSDPEDDVPFEVYCDLIERQLRSALEDVEFIRNNPDKSKDRCHMLRASLANARHYLLRKADLFELVEWAVLPRPISTKYPGGVS